LKTIPVTAAHTYIAHIWQCPPPPLGGAEPPSIKLYRVTPAPIAELNEFSICLANWGVLVRMLKWMSKYHVFLEKVMILLINDVKVFLISSRGSAKTTCFRTWPSGNN